MSWWFCCCSRGDCPIFADDFNRASSTNLGPDWEEIIGDSEISHFGSLPDISDGELEMPPDSLVKALAIHPVWHYTGQVSATLTDINVGDKFRVLIQYSADDDSFLFAEYEAISLGVGILRVGSGIRNTTPSIFHAILASDNGPGSVLTVCRSPRGIYADISTSMIAWACVDPPAVPIFPWRSGLQNSGLTNIVKWDDFAFTEHRFTRPTAVCAVCECECEGYCIGKTLTLTVFTDDGFCSCVNGFTVTLNWSDNGLPEWVWFGTAEWPDDLCLGGTMTVDFDLTCAENGIDWTLNVNFSGACLAYAQGFLPESANCSPFNLRFPSAQCDISDPAECNYYYIVTE